MPNSTALLSVAASLAENPAIAKAIDTIVAEVRESQASIIGVKPPQDDLIQSYEATLEQFAKNKGRGPYFPYLGSGVGNGPLVELADGSVKWDMINGIGVSMFGHSNPEMIEVALRAAMGDTIMQGNLQCNEDSVEFAQLLVDEASRSSNLKHCFLTNSGAMANESALKVCMQYKGGLAPRVIAFADCFMGRTLAMSQLGDSAAGRVGLPLNMQVDYMPFFDPEHGDRSIEEALDQLKRYIARYPGQHCCFVMELIQGEGGFNLGPREFFEPLMKLCREQDVPIWIDEIQTFGRTETMFHFEQLGLGQYIDVLTLGKMSQVCACLYTEGFNPKPGLLSGTFIGSTVGLNVGRWMLQTLRDEGFYGPQGKIATLHEAFCEQATKLEKAHPDWFGPIPHDSGLECHALGHHGGIGGMMRLTPFEGKKDKILALVKVMFEEGLIAFFCGHDPYHIRFLPPVGVMKPEQFEPVFQVLEKAMAKVAQQS
ncbi:MAG: aminotransferase class III-fold pyridoxal phosphate-dependent enzyme [Planctomycetota bacterium]|nr:aminotransferase class III-fold pyridoxal phosphate-dependent enzyme [Planctomycetota bacterium]